MMEQVLNQDILIPGHITPRQDYWLYLDEYNQLWKIVRGYTLSEGPLRLILLEKDYRR